MSAVEHMQSGRRRSLPGMVSSPPRPQEQGLAAEPSRDQQPTADSVEEAGVREQRSVDYSATRLVNFRLPVDVHDRFRTLIRDVEERYPRLRKASLTELVVALLEEGPQTSTEVAELIRRKRLAENEER